MGYKLSTADAEFIKKNFKAYDPEFGAGALAKKFNVARSTIYSIVNDKKYHKPVVYIKKGIKFCPTNMHIICMEQDKCESCGWNKKVEEMRKKEIERMVETYGETAFSFQNSESNPGDRTEGQEQ